jgi:hypothetical protein
VRGGVDNRWHPFWYNTGVTLSRLQRIIESSTLPEEDKDLWLHALDGFSDEDADVVLDALTGEDHLQPVLEELTRSIKLKRLAIETGDEALFKQVLTEEVQQIEDL